MYTHRDPTEDQTSGRPSPSIARCQRKLASLRAEDGQALVEFALVLVPFLLVFLGICYFGLALNGQIDETHLAGDAARLAAVNSQTVNTETRLQKWVEQNGDSASVRKAKATLCFPKKSKAIGEPVEVKLEYTNEWAKSLRNLLPGIAPSSKIKSTAQMRIEVPLAEAEVKEC